MTKQQVALQLALSSCLLLPVLHAQAPAQPSFDVATIKPSDPSTPRHMIGVMNTPDGLDAQLAPLSMLLRSAYGNQNFPLDAQIVGLPDWAKSQSYDIQAKLSEADTDALHKLSPQDQKHLIEQMLQSLLADRFNLKLHRGTMQLPAYDLVVAKNGPKIKPTGDDKVQLTKDDNGHPSKGTAFFKGPGEIVIQQETMGQFATFLTQQPGGPGRPVVDKTGLTGLFTFTLHWSSIRFVGQPQEDESIAPSLFTVLQEDLGLRLQPSTTTLETLIIDHIDPPSAN